MPLIIDGQPRDLIDIRAFRERYNLPSEFGAALFEPKNYEGLGRIDQGGEALNALRATVLDAIPSTLPFAELMDFMPRLGNLFRVKLYEVNEAVGLRPVEIDFAAAGFEDVGQALLYALVRTRSAKTSVDFERIYADWLDGTVRVTQTAHVYTHQGSDWQVRTLNTAYGRIGLVVETPDETHYVRDVTLACPAEGFMYSLLRAAAAKITAALVY